MIVTLKNERDQERNLSGLWALLAAVLKGGKKVNSFVFPRTGGEGCTVLNNEKHLCQLGPGFGHSLLSLLLYCLF